MTLFNTRGNADANIITRIIQDIISKMNNLLGAWFKPGSITSDKLAPNSVTGAKVKRGAFDGTKFVAAILNATHFVRTGAGSNLDADQVDGLHAGQIGCLGVASKTLASSSLLQYGAGVGFDLGYYRMEFLPDDFALTVFPDPAHSPWAVQVEFSAALRTNLGEKAGGNGGLPAVPRGAGWALETQATDRFVIVIYSEFGQQFWTPGGEVATVTVTASLLRQAGQSI